MLAPRAIVPDRIRPLRRVEYEVLVNEGLLEDSRVELLLGNLVEVTPQGPLHAEIVSRLTARLVPNLPPSVHVRIQSPLALSDDSEPEPDVAVVAAEDYSKAHPQKALFVIEVAHTSMQKDRGIKAALYATAGVPEFWLVNLADKVVEVYRQPSGGRYDLVHRVTPGGVVAPEAFPEIQIAAADLLG